MKKYISPILFLISVSLVLYFYYPKTNQPDGEQKITETAHAATIRNAASCERDAVQEAISQAQDGDTVTIPAGQCTWTSKLTISKAITLQGAGGTSTKITNGYVGDGMITISPASDLAIRVTGLYIYNATNNNGYTSILINGKKDGSFALSKIRIDNNRIEMGSRCIDPEGWITGLIDTNTFVNCNIAIAGYGDGNYAWNRSIAAGTVDFLFIENNTFTINNSSPREPNEQIYGNSHGHKYVVRYNTFDGASYTAGNYLPFETHGNWGAFGKTPQYRGPPILEFYNNTVNVHHTYRLMNIRGGSILVHNNTFTMGSGGGGINLVEEEAWASGGLWCPACPVDDTWPAWDQVTNSFFWNNTLNGSPINPGLASSYEIPMIRQDYEYFLHAPQSSGGKSTYPTTPGKNDMTFSSSGANAYYPYTPYTYPHPIRTDCVNYPTLCNAGSYPACTYTYSTWGTCQPNNAQTRTVTSSSPVGCTGTPILSQSCVYVPQAFQPEQYIEAESGTLSSPVQTGSDSLASGGSYVSTATDNSGSVSFTFNVSQAGQYMMEAKVNSNNDGGQNSFYVGLDSENPQNNNYYAYDIPVISGYVWDNVNRRGNGTSTPQFDPMIWTLTAGLHTFTFYGRESNTWLDQIILKRVTTDTTPPAPPSGVRVQ